MSAERLPKNANATVPVYGSLAEQVLAEAQANRETIQNFVPLAESLEWELGQQYLRDRGNKAFIADSSPIPFVINNDGTLSRNAAEVFFTSLLEADKAGTLEEDIFVLELGIGVGLFCRFFLDHFQALCAKKKKSYYSRLCYIAGDISERMLTDVLRHGVLANHLGRVRTRIVNALDPDKHLEGDPAFRNLKNPARPFRAVFLNYLLDCLPAAVLQFDGDRVKQLHVRTCVARNVKLSEYTDWTVKQLQELARSKDPHARQELLEVYGLFASEYDYRPVDLKKLPNGGFLAENRNRLGERILHSYGAIQCLGKLLGMIVEDGFILVNDYGQTQTSRDDEFEHQRFSLATFVGVNFPLLKAYFGDQGKCQWLQPSSGTERGIHSRLLTPKNIPEVTSQFIVRFADHAYEKLQEPIQKARMCARAGRFELASDFYMQALKTQPGNWVLLNEVSMFMTFQMRDPKRATDMAKLALSHNPTCSAELWNTLGDALYEFGRTGEAKGAYQQAMAVNAADVRSRFNLAFVYMREKDYPAALRSIAEALALDKMGEYRERLLHKQQEVLHHMTQRHQQEYLLLINLVSKYAKPNNPEAADAPAVLSRPMDPPPEARQ